VDRRDRDREGAASLCLTRRRSGGLKPAADSRGSLRPRPRGGDLVAVALPGRGREVPPEDGMRLKGGVRAVPIVQLMTGPIVQLMTGPGHAGRSMRPLLHFLVLLAALGFLPRMASPGAAFGLEAAGGAFGEEGSGRPDDSGSCAGMPASSGWCRRLSPPSTMAGRVAAPADRQGGRPRARSGAWRLAALRRGPLRHRVRCRRASPLRGRPTCA
jgi:hypothetical protein